MRTSLKFRLGKAFTLIELLIVITIIGILAVALVPRISQGPARARDVARKADLQNISNALELLYSDTGSYPTALSSITNYMSAVPNDPSTSASYTYTKISNSSYIIAAQLETATATGDNIVSLCAAAPTTLPPNCSAGTNTYYYLSQ